MRETYIIACCTPWFWEEWDVSDLPPGKWIFVKDKIELQELDIDNLKPRYIFFPHWRSIVPKSLTDAYECICFHMTPLPFGRGGSPLQNLIVRGLEETKLSVLKMVPELDAGPVYYQIPMVLCGSAEEIYLRVAKLIARQIRIMVEEQPIPVPQTGEPVCFPRRTPGESMINENLSTLPALYDFIRMLDAEGYPNAFIEYGPFKLSFKRACRRLGAIEADVRIELKKENA